MLAWPTRSVLALLSLLCLTRHVHFDECLANYDLAVQAINLLRGSERGLLCGGAGPPLPPHMGPSPDEDADWILSWGNVLVNVPLIADANADATSPARSHVELTILWWAVVFG